MRAALDHPSGDTRPEHLDHRPDRSTDRIDFTSIDAAAERAAGQRAEQRLLTSAENRELISDRQRVPVDVFHPDRLKAADTAALDNLMETHPSRANVVDWSPEINPGFIDDAVQGRAGRTQNCADCARAVQETIDGSPRVASAIDDRGLPLDSGRAAGEDVAYTEQWAGQRFVDADYEAVARRVAADHGSAIIVGFGNGGHAFNAVWDGQRVKLVDGQTGRTYDWERAPYRDRFDTFQAIYFTPKDVP